MPPGAGSGAGADRCGVTPRVYGRVPDRCRRAEWPERGGLVRGAGRERAAPPARLAARARRVAGRARADAPSAARPAPPRRDRALGDRHRLRERLRKPASLQRRLPRAVRDEPQRPAASIVIRGLWRLLRILAPFIERQL